MALVVFWEISVPALSITTSWLYQMLWFLEMYRGEGLSVWRGVVFYTIFSGDLYYPIVGGLAKV